jgi:hypothetical protein
MLIPSTLSVDIIRIIYMIVKDTAKWLLDNAYMILVHGRPILTAKFEKELGYNRESQEEQVPEESIVPVSSPNNSGDAMKRITDPKDVWNAFIHDAEIPHRVKSTDGSTYTVRQYGASVARKLQKIIQDPKIDYWRLVESTKNYYRVTSYKALLSNYIGKDIWLNEYQEWNKDKTQIKLSDGGNRWETE